MKTSRRERLVWRVLRLDATLSGAMVAVSLIAVPVLWLVGVPGGVLALVGLAVIVAAAVLGILGAVLAGVLAAQAGDVDLPDDLAGLHWPGAPLLGERHTWRGDDPPGSRTSARRVVQERDQCDCCPIHRAQWLSTADAGAGPRRLKSPDSSDARLARGSSLGLR